MTWWSAIGTLSQFCSTHAQMWLSSHSSSLDKSDNTRLTTCLPLSCMMLAPLWLENAVCMRYQREIPWRVQWHALRLHTLNSSLRTKQHRRVRQVRQVISEKFNIFTNHHTNKIKLGLTCLTRWLAKWENNPRTYICWDGHVPFALHHVCIINWWNANDTLLCPHHNSLVMFHWHSVAISFTAFSAA